VVRKNEETNDDLNIVKIKFLKYLFFNSWGMSGRVAC